MDRIGVKKTLGIGGALFTCGAFYCYKGALPLGFALMGLSSSTFFVAGAYNTLSLPRYMRGYCMDALYILGGLGTLTSSAAILQVSHISVGKFFQFILVIASGLTLLLLIVQDRKLQVVSDPKGVRREIPWLSAIFSALTLNAVSLVSDAYGSTLWRTHPRINVWAFLLIISIIGSLGFFLLRAVMRILSRADNLIQRPPSKAHNSLFLVIQPYLISALLGTSALTLLLRLFQPSAESYQLMVSTGAILAFYAVTRLVFLDASLGSLPTGREAFTIAIWNSFNALGRVGAELYLWIYGISVPAIKGLVIVYLLLSLAVLLVMLLRRLSQCKHI
jgi:hypothetical protein